MNGHKGKTEVWWRRRITEQQAGELTVRDYCEAHDLSQSSFYAWKNKLALIDEAATRHDGADRADSPPQPFFSVRVPAVAVNGIEVVHPNGCVVRVPAGFEPQVLRDVLAVLDGEEA